MSSLAAGPAPPTMPVGVVETLPRRRRGRIGSADAQSPLKSDPRFCFGGDSAHGLALERDAIGVVHQPIEDRVGMGGFTDHFVPEIHGQLAGHHGGFAVVTVIEDVEQVAALGGRELRKPPVVDLC